MCKQTPSRKTADVTLHDPTSEEGKVVTIVTIDNQAITAPALCQADQGERALAFLDPVNLVRLMSKYG